MRLNKDCQPIQTVRKRRTVNKAQATKTQRLEAKLDGLFKLLQPPTPSTSLSSSNASTSIPPITTELARESLHSQGPCFQDGMDSVARAIQLTIDGPRMNSPTSTADAPYVASGTRSTIYHCSEGSLMGDLEPTSDEAEEYLRDFRTHLVTYFPFVNVPKSTNASDLRRDRPFLWLCMLSITPKSTPRLKAHTKEMKITMGREILVEGKNNIDLLLGLLVFVAW